MPRVFDANREPGWLLPRPSAWRPCGWQDEDRVQSMVSGWRAPLSFRSIILPRGRQRSHEGGLSPRYPVLSPSALLRQNPALSQALEYVPETGRSRGRAATGIPDSARLGTCRSVSALEGAVARACISHFAKAPRASQASPQAHSTESVELQCCKTWMFKYVASHTLVATFDEPAFLVSCPF